MPGSYGADDFKDISRYARDKRAKLFCFLMIGLHLPGLTSLREHKRGSGLNKKGRLSARRRTAFLYKQGKRRYTESIPEALCAVPGGSLTGKEVSMKKIVLSCLLLALLLPAAGCAAREEEGRVTVVATTYPIYLFARAVTDGAEGVVVERLDTGSTSCLHDYTLSMADMKKLERADLIALNGAGLEDFLSDALAASDAEVVDCSAGVELLENLSHHHEEGDEDHDHGHYDPHYWMDPANVPPMLDSLAEGLARIMPEWGPLLRTNAGLAAGLVERELSDTDQKGNGGGLTHRELITFHDGFQYFARAFGLKLLAAIEEEAGSEASAREIVEITQLVGEYEIPAIFTEVNGSDATANAIGRETGCQVRALDMLMSGDDVPQDWGLEEIMEQYISRLKGDLDTVREALG